MLKLPSELYQVSGDQLTCWLCFKKCAMKPGEVGFCGNRAAAWRGQELVPVFRQVDRLEAFNIDPIEKKPLYHFYPGRDIVSVGLRGCNMQCYFCQNFQLSQDQSPQRYSETTAKNWPEELLQVLERENRGGKMVPGIAFTYSEPVTWFEFMHAVAQKLSQNNYTSVIVSNGMMTESTLRVLVPYLQAANIDVKSLDKAVYQRLGGDRDMVKHTVEKLFEAGVHVEVTYLVVPGLNDRVTQIETFIDWVAGISREIPVHFSRYFPTYKASEPPTPVEALTDIYKKASDRLAYVYLGNLGDKAYQTTYCPDCGAAVIERNLFSVTSCLDRGQCTNCGRKLAGAFE